MVKGQRQSKADISKAMHYYESIFIGHNK